MGAKFAHISVLDGNEGEIAASLNDLTTNAISCIEMIRKSDPDIKEKYINFLMVNLESTRQQLQTIMISNYEINNAMKLFEHTHSMRTPYYVTKNGEWLTIYNEDFGFDDVDDIALSISRKIAKLILTVANFDDDIFILSLIKDGKILAQHISGETEYYGKKETLGDIKVMSEALKIIGKEHQLESILNEKDILHKFEYLEDFLNMHLWILRTSLPQKSNDLKWKKVTIL